MMKPLGSLKVVTGPMFSGKTSNLIEVVQQSFTNGISTQIFRPTIDTRHPRPGLMSHNGFSCPAEWLDETDCKFTADVILIDEAQFLRHEFVERVIVDHLNDGRHFVVAGLDLDAFGVPFGPMPTLLSLADEVIKLRARCHICDRPANRTFKRTQSKSTVEIGGSDIYESRCLSCWQTRP